MQKYTCPKCGNDFESNTDAPLVCTHCGEQTDAPPLRKKRSKLFWIIPSVLAALLTVGAAVWYIWFSDSFFYDRALHYLEQGMDEKAYSYFQKAQDYADSSEYLAKFDRLLVKVYADDGEYEYFYDESNRIIKEVFEAENKDKSTTTTYTYSGYYSSIHSKTITYADGSSRTYIYRYYPTVIEEIRIDKNGKESQYKYDYIAGQLCKIETTYNNACVERIRNECNSEGQIIKTTTEDVISDSITVETFSYDINGDLTEKRCGSTTTTYKRNENGRIMEKTVKSTGFLGSTEVYEYIYDADGYLTEITLDGASYKKCEYKLFYNPRMIRPELDFVFDQDYS